MIEVEYRPTEDDAPSQVLLSNSRMRKDYRVKRSQDGFEILISPRLDPNDGCEGTQTKALIEALQGADELMIGLGLIIEAAFLTGIEIGKKG